jgi:hypothetical protein
VLHVHPPLPFDFAASPAHSSTAVTGRQDERALVLTYWLSE